MCLNLSLPNARSLCLHRCIFLLHDIIWYLRRHFFTVFLKMRRTFFGVLFIRCTFYKVYFFWRTFYKAYFFIRLTFFKSYIVSQPADFGVHFLKKGSLIKSTLKKIRPNPKKMRFAPIRLFLYMRIKKHITERYSLPKALLLYLRIYIQTSA